MCTKIPPNIDDLFDDKNFENFCHQNFEYNKK